MMISRLIRLILKMNDAIPSNAGGRRFDMPHTALMESICNCSNHASASVPINYSYTTLEVESYNNKANYEKNIRYFWDSGIMSNTPLIQLVRLHTSILAQSKRINGYCPEARNRNSQRSSS